jgi:hypothetical protein
MVRCSLRARLYSDNRCAVEVGGAHLSSAMEIASKKEQLRGEREAVSARRDADRLAHTKPGF